MICIASIIAERKKVIIQSLDVYAPGEKAVAPSYTKKLSRMSLVSVAGLLRCLRVRTGQGPSPVPDSLQSGNIGTGQIEDYEHMPTMKSSPRPVESWRAADSDRH